MVRARRRRGTRLREASKLKRPGQRLLWKDGWIREERQHTTFEFHGFEAKRGGMKRARHDPQRFRPAGCRVNPLRVAARKCCVLCAANQKNGELAARYT